VHGSAAIVEVDGLGFRACGDADAPTLEAPGGARVTFKPWTLAAHLAACDAAVRVDGGRLHIDAHAFAAAVLRHCGAAPDTVPELAPVALWWAAGAGKTLSAPIDRDGWLPLTRGRARLQPWTWAARCRAVDASLVPGTDHEFRLTPYLAAMLRATVVAAEDVDLDALAGADAQRLLAAVVAVNSEAGPLEDTLAAASPAAASRLAADTLRLCKALGWTPSQVCALPAVEAQRLLALLDRVAPTPPPPPAPAPRPAYVSRLAGYPDAVVIRVEDDP
jgi:hypothetical protein